MLTVVGGTYLEFCQEPYKEELYGSGFRGAAALAGHISSIVFHSCVGTDMLESATINCAGFGITPFFTVIPQTYSFTYYHPLSRPVVHPEVLKDKYQLPAVSAENILMYGLLEAAIQVQGNYVVYDPQNWESFRSTGSVAQHLALVLNRKEALLLSNMPTDYQDLAAVGKLLLQQEDAEVVVIKNGTRGATVVDSSGITLIPVFDTNTVWPIGSGDIFSATFAWKWAVEQLPPAKAAHLASQLTAEYCETKRLPLPATPAVRPAQPTEQPKKYIYLAGPFFTMAERWLITELRKRLLEFENEVFSPLHDIGWGTAKVVAEQDLIELRKADVLCAIGSGMDPGTLFEIGYAQSLGKRILVFVENTREHDLTMLEGTGCEIISDFSTLVYKASW